MVRKYFVSGVISGIFVGIAGSAYLACDNRYIGSALFSIGLLSVCLLGYSLFTGKVGLIVEQHKTENFAELLLCLPGNTVGASAIGFAVAAVIPARGAKALEMCTAKLGTPLPSAFVLAVCCGILMYLGVEIYRKKQNIIGILFCVPVFILSGFEHSIADMFFFAASGIVSLRAFVFICVVILGNAAGGMLIPALRLLMGGNRDA